MDTSSNKKKFKCDKMCQADSKIIYSEKERLTKQTKLFMNECDENYLIGKKFISNCFTNLDLLDDQFRKSYAGMEEWESRTRFYLEDINRIAEQVEKIEARKINLKDLEKCKKVRRSHEKCRSA